MTLTEGTNYEVSYKNNTEPGTATIVVTGKGAYQGVVEENFLINAVDITVADYEAIAVTTAKGVCPALPGTVIAIYQRRVIRYWMYNGMKSVPRTVKTDRNL